MTLLKEDGSLDVEYIKKLPIEEKMKQIGSLTNEQYKEYIKSLPLNESHQHTRPVIVNYTLEEDIKLHRAVIAEDFLNNMKEKYGGK